MKNKLGYVGITLVGLLIVVAILIVAFWLAYNLAAVHPKDMTAYVKIQDGDITFKVSEYRRISSGWIEITSEDGHHYKLNEKNVILEGE